MGIAFRRSGPVSATEEPDALDAYDIAFLAGGAQRVADSALIALCERGLLKLSGSRVRAVGETPPPQHPVEAALFASCPRNRNTASVLTALQRSPEVQEIARRLAARSLVTGSRHRLTRQGRRQLRAAEHELFGGSDVYVVTVSWSWEPHGAELPPERREEHAMGSRWLTLAYEDDPEPEFHTYTHLYADRRTWRRGSADGILRAVADDVLSGVFITDTGLRRIHHPYDGGADVIVPTPEERDRLRDRHPEWLSGMPSGL